MRILSSNAEDVTTILELYDTATAYQKTKGAVQWPKFHKDFVLKEIKEKKQWKLVINNEIVCVWAHAFEDPQIWEERSNEPAIYIHRIATNPTFRGKGLVTSIVEWAKEYAIKNNKHYVRMDTVGENKGLIQYYQRCGFEFLGLVKLKNTDGLPDHYKKDRVSLFQMILS